jgi:hypothetical protein
VELARAVLLEGDGKKLVSAVIFEQSGHGSPRKEKKIVWPFSALL